ncbi:hypothetical protein A2803_00445 [Candidatus Woesebacteria bacterium RIFCSPHIGHO2_01_FULL_44_21]|uniref:GIY-YIG domain-containing protein n=1 Tax=Candidatus Woesebacteria bacterium RIFCSPHIGHO2_01_FULL_44_21 TaxID=1802503 RepID=A0A1F7YYR7_9BACT|nr:MAG: hypothetical protein A2803_00445 [Candidatus Woesebacteria bacterium RIFCSPHIGHO2_01_FULL_44_21]OGM68944.1 MAG: hypothetical protein A2897_02220 [Candidatus Woesebacteria bacterium RIFCSPLOWO2_01_FULL_44_24b]
MYFAYILYSQPFDKYYIGSTSNLQNRIDRHNNGGSRYTRPFRPWALVYSEKFKTGSEAAKREKEIKRYKGGNSFKQLLSGQSHPA